MQKGQETKNGVYLGERMRDREKRLSRKDAEDLVDKLAKRRGADEPEGDRDNQVAVLQDREVVAVFDKNGKEVEIPLDKIRS